VNNVIDFPIAPPPARFSKAAKEEWPSVPGEMRNEILRIHRELEAEYTAAKTAALRNAELNEFHALAEASGTTLEAALHCYTNLEHLLKEDFSAGIVEICKNIGIDPVDLATVIAAGVHLAHGMFLAHAAQAIRDEPDRDWEGIHFGCMAHEVQVVCPECVIKQPNGYLAVDYGRLSKTPEARSLPVHCYRYKDFVQFLDEPTGALPDAVA
jgi:hypothetical protein